MSERAAWPGEPTVFALEVPATLGFLRVVCACVVAACDLHSDAAHAVSRDLELAVQEMGSNAVLHAYRGRGDGWLRVEVALDAVGVTVQLTDGGREFVPSDVPDLAPGEVRVRGYGLHLLRQLVDEVEYRRDGDRNRWRLHRRYPTAPSSLGMTGQGTG